MPIWSTAKLAPPTASDVDRLSVYYAQQPVARDFTAEDLSRFAAYYGHEAAHVDGVAIPDHYRALGLSQGATSAEIAAAHAAAVEALAASGTKDLSRTEAVENAWAVLSDDAQRAVYDAQLAANRPERWQGNGAHFFGRGLEHFGVHAGDEVSEEAIRALFEGRSPTGEPLAWANNHRPKLKAYDATMAFEKEVSVLMSMAMFEGRHELAQRIYDLAQQAVVDGLASFDAELSVTRRGGQGREHRSASGLVGVMAGHHVARPTYGAGTELKDPAPHLHFHCLIFNIAEVDGMWSSLDGQELYARQAMIAQHIGQLFRERTARSYGDGGADLHWRKNESGPTWTIAGFDRGLKEKLSPRRASILAEMLSKNADPDDPEAWRRFGLATREGKTSCSSDPAGMASAWPAIEASGLTIDQLTAFGEVEEQALERARQDRRWLEVDQQMGPPPVGDQLARKVWLETAAIKLAGRHPIPAAARSIAAAIDGARAIELKPDVAAARAAAAVDARTDQQRWRDALEAVGDARGYFAEEDLRAALYAEGASVDAATAAIAAWQTDGGFEVHRGIVAGPGLGDVLAELGMVVPARQRPVLVSKKVVEAQRSVEALARRTSADFTPLAATTAQMQAVLDRHARAGKPLDPGSDQWRAAERILTGTSTLLIISGKAGAGKSAVASVAQLAAEIAQESGDHRTIWGASLAANAARNLQSESGIKSLSIADLAGRLDRGEVELHRGDLIVLDEASQASITQVADFAQRAQLAGARLVLLGDRRQLGAVEAGGLMARLVDLASEDSAVSDKVVWLDETRRQDDPAERAVLSWINDGRKLEDRSVRALRAVAARAEAKLPGSQARLERMIADLQARGLDAVVDFYAAGGRVHLAADSSETVPQIAARTWDSIEEAEHYAATAVRVSWEQRGYNLAALDGEAEGAYMAELDQARRHALFHAVAEINATNEEAGRVADAILAEGRRRGRFSDQESFELGGQKWWIGQPIVNRRNLRRDDEVLNGQLGTVAGQAEVATKWAVRYALPGGKVYSAQTTQAPVAGAQTGEVVLTARQVAKFRDAALKSQALWEQRADRLADAIQRTEDGGGSSAKLDVLRKSHARAVERLQAASDHSAWAQELPEDGGTVQLEIDRISEVAHETQLEVQWDDGHSSCLPSSQLRHLDRGLATTAQRGQGQTVWRAITTSVGYVALSRATNRTELFLVDPDLEEAREAARREAASVQVAAGVLAESAGLAPEQVERQMEDLLERVRQADAKLRSEETAEREAALDARARILVPHSPLAMDLPAHPRFAPPGPAVQRSAQSAQSAQSAPGEEDLAQRLADIGDLTTATSDRAPKAVLAELRRDPDFADLLEQLQQPDGCRADPATTPGLRHVMDTLAWAGWAISEQPDQSTSALHVDLDDRDPARGLALEALGDWHAGGSVADYAAVADDSDLARTVIAYRRVRDAVVGPDKLSRAAITTADLEACRELPPEVFAPSSLANLAPILAGGQTSLVAALTDGAAIAQAHAEQEVAEDLAEEERQQTAALATADELAEQAARLDLPRQGAHRATVAQAEIAGHKIVACPDGEALRTWGTEEIVGGAQAGEQVAIVAATDAMVRDFNNSAVRAMHAAGLVGEPIEVGPQDNPALFAVGVPVVAISAYDHGGIGVAGRAVVVARAEDGELVLHTDDQRRLAISAAAAASCFTPSYAVSRRVAAAATPQVDRTILVASSSADPDKRAGLTASELQALEAGNRPVEIVVADPITALADYERRRVGVLFDEQLTADEARKVTPLDRLRELDRIMPEEFQAVPALQEARRRSLEILDRPELAPEELTRARLDRQLEQSNAAWDAAAAALNSQTSDPAARDAQLQRYQAARSASEETKKSLALLDAQGSLLDDPERAERRREMIATAVSEAEVERRSAELRLETANKGLSISAGLMVERAVSDPEWAAKYAAFRAELPADRQSDRDVLEAIYRYRVRWGVPNNERRLLGSLPAHGSRREREFRAVAEQLWLTNELAALAERNQRLEAGETIERARADQEELTEQRRRYLAEQLRRLKGGAAIEQAQQLRISL